MRWMLVGLLIACRSTNRAPEPPIAIPRDATLEITGHVSAGGQPVAGATVALISPAGLEHHAITDAAGAFVMRGARTTTLWGISAYAPGYAGAFIDEIDPARPVHVTLAKPGADDVTIRLPVRSTEPLPRDAAMIISRKSTNNADVWVVPVDAQTATVTIPRAPSYFARGVDSVAAVAGSVEFADVAAPPVVEVAVMQPAPAAVAAYLRDHAVRLSTVEAGHGFADLAGFGALVGGASVVAVGEATHGTREFFQLKHRLFEYLATEKQFTTFAFEADQAECRAIDAYVQGGPGDARTVVGAINLWVWRTEEVVALVEWMRTYNASHATKLHFVGFDMQSWTPAYTSLQRFLAGVAPSERDALASAAGPLATLRLDADELAAYWTLSDANKTALAAALAAAQRAVEAHAEAAGADIARRDVRALAQFVEYLRTSDDATRDRFMADNIAALHAAAPNEKMMVWAHNYHVGRYSFVPSMGIHLQKALGRAYLAIGFVFGSGTFAAAGSRRDGTVTDAEVHGFGAPTPLDAAAPFVASGVAQFALDLRALPQGPVGAWFAAPHLLREIGWLYTGEIADTKPRTLTEHFDAVLFVARSTPARALK